MRDIIVIGLEHKIAAAMREVLEAQGKAQVHMADDCVLMDVEPRHPVPNLLDIDIRLDREPRVKDWEQRNKQRSRKRKRKGRR